MPSLPLCTSLVLPGASREVSRLITSCSITWSSTTVLTVTAPSLPAAPRKRFGSSSSSSSCVCCSCSSSSDKTSALPFSSSSSMRVCLMLVPVNLSVSSEADKVSPDARIVCAMLISATVLSVLPVRVNPQKITAAIATESIAATAIFPQRSMLCAFVLKFCIKFSFVLKIAICKIFLLLCILAGSMSLYSSSLSLSRKSPL